MTRKASFDFSDTTVLVTGGSSGIGLAIARAFVAAGADVTITGTRASAADYGDDLAAFAFRQCDVGDPAQVQALAHSLAAVDILVNNAGIWVPPPDGLTPEAFERTATVNLNAVYRLSHLLHPKLKARAGVVVNIGSLASRYAWPSPGYSASKAGVENVTQSLAAAWASDGIRVNNIAPGFVRTKSNEAAWTNERFNRRAIAHTPLGRWGEPADIAGAALFLASDGASHITGVTLVIDGGFATLW